MYVEINHFIFFSFFFFVNQISINNFRTRCSNYVFTRWESENRTVFDSIALSSDDNIIWHYAITIQMRICIHPYKQTMNNEQSQNIYIRKIVIRYSNLFGFEWIDWILPKNQYELLGVFFILRSVCLQISDITPINSHWFWLYNHTII